MTPARGSISVAIPTKDGARHIGEALHSVFQQTRPPDDVVVVDDGSTDDTVAVVSSFPSPTLRLVENSGRGANAARATAIAATESTYVALLDHDDVWFPDHLEVLAGALDGTPYPAAYARARKFDATPSPGPPTPAELLVVNLWDRFPVNVVGGPSSVVIRRSSLVEIGGWPTWDRVPSDVYMGYRLADLGPFVQWPHATSGWRRHSASLSARMHDHDRVGYQRSRYELLRDAHEVHAARQPGDARRTASRLSSYRTLVDLFSTMCNGDGGAMTAALEDLARTTDLAEDPISTVQIALQNAAGCDSGARVNVWRSYGAWPRRHRDLRRRIADPAMAGAIAYAVRSHPGQPSLWGIPTQPGIRSALRPLADAIAGTAWRRLVRRYRHSIPGLGGMRRRVSRT